FKFQPMRRKYSTEDAVLSRLANSSTVMMETGTFLQIESIASLRVACSSVRTDFTKKYSGVTVQDSSAQVFLSGERRTTITSPPVRAIVSLPKTYDTTSP